MRYVVYPAYKDSGVPWLGAIPAHWETRRLKYSAPESGEKLDEKPEDMRYIGLENIESGTGRLLLDDPIEEVESTVVAFKEGDVLFGKLRPYLAKVVHIDFKGVGTTELLVLRPRTDTDNQFLFYSLLSDGFIETINSLTYGAKMPRANMDQVGGLRVPNPPLSEQRAIAAFLDRETAKLDALTRKFEQLLDRLEERRAALISHAVTKGLDPDVEMKASGIPWLGEIPAHWEILKAKYLFRLSTERAPENNDYELLSLYTDIGVEPRKNLEPKGNKASTTDGYWIVRKGDIILNKLLAWMGAIGYSEYEGVTSPAYDILRRKAALESKYYHHLFRCGLYLTEFRRRSRGIMDMRLRLYFDEFGQILLPYPPLHEQRAIVNHLDRETAKLDALAAKVRAAIGCLDEYRTALISAAVTGKIDVRESS
jgi:type I restriction enzyme S subunit